MTRAIGYVRLSSYRGDTDPTTSPDRQRAAITGYCTAKDWQLTATIEDLDVSGSDRGLRLDRPGLTQIRAALPSVDVVIFAKLDRLARNVADFAAFAEEAHAHGVALVSVAESLDLTTPSGKFVATILAAFAEMEAATIAERTRAGRAAARAQGRWTGGTAPFGMRAVQHPGGGVQLATDPEEAAHLHQIMQWVSEGWSTGRIARQLDHLGIPPRRGGRWQPSTVWRMLNGAAQRGQLTPTEERIWAERPKQGAATRARKAKRLLSGVLRCASCGMPLVVGATGRDSDPAYRCSGKRLNRGSCPQPVSITAAVEEVVTAEWLDSFGDLPETRTVRAADATDARISSLGGSIEQATAELATADRARRAALVAELDRLEDERDRLRAAPPSVLSVVEDTGRTLGQAWAASSVEGRRELVKAWMGPVTVRPWRKGDRVADRLSWVTE